MQVGNIQQVMCQYADAETVRMAQEAKPTTLYRRVCIEVACRDASFSDGYGNSIDRTSACYNSAQSLVLRVTDNCPCHYPNNAYSNSRWCAVPGSDPDHDHGEDSSDLSSRLCTHESWP